MSATRLPSVLVLFAAVATVGVTARLGVWQLDRASTKLAIQAALDARTALPPLDGAALARDAEGLEAQRHRNVRLQGNWVAGATVFLENRQMHGQPGFFVVTPLRVAGSDDAVLVQRGWAPRDLMDRRKVPAVPTPDGPVEVLGRVADVPGRLYELGESAADGPLRLNLDAGAFAREIGVPLRPLSVVQDDGSPAGAGDGLQREWAAPAVDVSRHHGYAFQWFALCALTTGLYVWFQLVRPRLSRRAE